MKHCYIFDYCPISIYHTRLPEDIEDIEDIEVYLCETYGFKSSQIYFMVADEELTIEDL